MKKLPLTARLAWQELHHGWRHFWIFLICLCLGVAVMASVGMLGATIKDALDREAQSLLGGDIEVTVSGGEASSKQRAYLEQFGNISEVSTLRSMIVHDGVPTLVEVKAVDAAYPLLGTLEVYEAVTPKDALSGNGVIVDPSLLTQFGLKIGDTITLGNSNFIIHATLKREPDRAVHIFSFGPRVMLRTDLLQASGLVQGQSLLKYHYRIALHEPEQREALAKEIRERHENLSWQVKTGTDSNQTLKRFMDQLITFLTLCGLATFLISGIGISSSVRAYLAKKSETIAIMKVLGSPLRAIFYAYALTLAILTALGCIAGVALASVLTSVLLPVLAEWLPVLKYAKPNLAPALLACWYGYLIVYLFSLPALSGALAIRPSLLFRSRSLLFELHLDKKVWLGELLLSGVLIASLLLASNDRLLIIGAVGMVILAFSLFGVATLLVRGAVRRIVVTRPWLRLALSNLYRPGSTSGTVIFAMGISLTVLIALALTEANFQSRITAIVNEKAPSLFLIDVQPHQKDALHDMLVKAAGDEHVMMHPMVRGRISAIGGKPVEENNVGEDVRWAVRGDRGISYSALPPENANISAGQWWAENYQGPPLMSVDERFLEGMGLSLGDTITLNILGKDIDAKIASTRHIDYTTFQINFAMMLSPGEINSFPHSYVATVHLEAGVEALTRELATAFPGITIIRTAEAVALVRSIVENVSFALRAAVLISLLSGLLVLASALTAMLEQRMYDVAVLKILGARRSDILKICSAEWMLLALVTALISGLLGTLASWLIMQRFRGEGFSLLPEVTLATIGFCIIAIWLIGYFGNRQLFSLRPARLLRSD